MKMAKSFPCIICGKELSGYGDPEEVVAQPDNGVMCTTYGNYGSTVFDPMDGSFLAFNICDDCLVEAGEKGTLFLTRKPYVHVEYEYTKWPQEFRI
jgi:hypothetical protein